MKNSSTLQAALVISGTSIGAGMLVLPTESAAAGFLPSLSMMLVCWLVMLVSGLCLAQGLLWMDGESHVSTLSERFLGRGGRALCASLFLFLYFCLLISYIAGSAPYFGRFASKVLGGGLSPSLIWLLYGLVLTLFIYWGTKPFQRLSSVLMMALMASFALMVFVGADEVRFVHLASADWSEWHRSAPVLFGAFGYHNIIPTIVTSLDRDPKRIRRALFAGTLLTLLIYLAWQWVVLGALSAEQLVSVESTGIPVISALQQVYQSQFFETVAFAFSLFAIMTSLLSVAFSMVAFQADALGLAAFGRARFLLCLTSLVPPLIIAAWKPNLFVKAFAYAGGFGESLLNGIIPIAIFWLGCYRSGLTDQVVPFGRKTLSGAALFVTMIIAVEFLLFLQ